MSTPTTGMISLEGIDKAAVLAALYNASHPQGMGFLQYDANPMTQEQAQELLNSGQTYFDYLKGRVMKVDLSGDQLNPRGYDRDNGAGAAERVVNALGSSFEEELIVPSKQENRLTIHDTIASAIAKMSEGNPGAVTVLMQLVTQSELGLLDVLGLDSSRLYGHRIWELYKLCGEDIERFSYHIQMELPNQVTGELSITGPYYSQVNPGAHLKARKFWKPGSFWGLKNPPTDSQYKYPILVNADGEIESGQAE